MPNFNFSRALLIPVLRTVIAFGCATCAFADTFSITYLAAGLQTPDGITNYETFDKATVSNGTLTTNFNGSSVTGTYSGNFAIVPADLYGGAKGSPYITTTGNASSYTLSLSQPVNYFGLWFSALDPGNYLDFYNGNSLVEFFSPQNFIDLVGKCSSGNEFCGNPNNGLDPDEQFAYLNFYDSNGAFDTIVFGQKSFYIGELESDNHAISNLTSIPNGTVISNDAPEPTSLSLVATGILGIAIGIRRRFAGNEP